MLESKNFIGNKNEWDKLTLKLNNNDFRQSFSWGEYLKSTGWNLERLIFEYEGDIKFTVQYTLKKFWPICIIYLPSGINGKSSYFYDFINEIKMKYKKYLLYIRVDIRTEKKDELLNEIKKIGFSKSIYSIRSREHMKVNLEDEIDIILKNTKQKWRYNYKKALKKNIKLERIKDLDPQEIYNLCKELSEFKSIRYLYQLKELKEFKKNLESYIECVRATDENLNILGYYVCIIHDNIAYQIFNAVNKNGNRLMAGYSILFEIIRNLKKKNIKELDLGELNQKRYPGNYQFKRGFNQRYYNVAGEYDWSSNIIIKYLINLYMLLTKA
ncbi:peptidoglycan bridge formation glycyltransferase FemA/FemB family protein [Candidatus Pelagibacter sp.]|nr:peptidoglycan bridge formation glycyltransferase FemA/FemB family protein [Candidatus Pelagibacter sp.]